MCFSVNVSVCLVCCVFVNCFVKQFVMCLGVVAILLLNFMDVFSVCGGALLDRPCMVLQKCVCCASDPNERLSAPSICFFLCFCMSEVISSFWSLRAESQVFALLCYVFE